MVLKIKLNNNLNMREKKIRISNKNSNKIYNLRLARLQVSKDRDFIENMNYIVD